MEQKTRDILKKIRLIDIKTAKVVNSVLSGAYHSSYKGQGIEFDEVKEYSPGDDIRTIDWNVTARMNAPYSKRFKEERELLTMILFDASASNQFGSGSMQKGEVAAEIAAILAFSAIKNNDKVGLVIFSDQIEKYIPPDKGREHVLRVIREILFCNVQNKATDINCALDFLNKVQYKKTVTFLISDFFASDFASLLKISAAKHDITGIRIYDPLEKELQACGFLELEDAESGEKMLVNTNDPAFLKNYRRQAEAAAAAKAGIFKRTGSSFLNIDVSRDYISDLIVHYKKLSHQRR